MMTTTMMITRSPPKVIWEEYVAIPHGRECSRLLRTCAASCAVPTADESNHSAAGTLHPHRSATCVW